MKWDELLCTDRIRMYQGRKNSSDMRTEFEKDYHRIIQSASFRRLQDKTQVFPLDRSDFVRTRLTHSLEVSSFGKSLGQNISQSIFKEIKDPEFLPEYATDVCDILQCAGLLHDIGNPPFGHFGETVIREWFLENMTKMSYKGKTLNDWLAPQMQQDFYHFEGNTQALRVVSKLHYLVDEHGMNLTKALLGTIIKYPVSSMEINKKSGDIKTKKMGYFYADKELFQEIQFSLGTNGTRHPLSFVLEAADDIAYLTADIEDAFKKGCISFGQLLMELKQIGEKLPENSEFQILTKKLEDKYQTALNRKEEQPEAYAIQNWIIRVQGSLIYHVTKSFTEHYAELMNGTMKQELLAGTGGEAMAKALGDIAYRYAFQSRPILKLEVAAQKMLSFLLDTFVPAAISYDSEEMSSEVQKKIISLVSENYLSIYKRYSKEASEAEKLYLRLLLVTDNICGMTDSHARNLYLELNGLGE